MNDKQAKRLRKIARNATAKLNYPERQLLMRVRGRRKVDTGKLDEKGERIIAEVPVGQVVNDMKSVRGVYRHFKRLFRETRVMP